MNDVRKALYLGIWKMLCLLPGYSVRLNSGIRSGAVLTQENLAASGLAGRGTGGRSSIRIRILPERVFHGRLLHAYFAIGWKAFLMIRKQERRMTPSRITWLRSEERNAMNGFKALKFCCCACRMSKGLGTRPY